MSKILEVLHVEKFQNYYYYTDIDKQQKRRCIRMSEEWTNELVPSMMPDGLCKAIAQEIGTDNLLKLSILIGGSTFYLPKRESILRPIRDIKIREEYNGYNTEELARKYNVSERWVCEIINRDMVNSVPK